MFGIFGKRGRLFAKIAVPTIVGFTLYQNKHLFKSKKYDVKEITSEFSEILPIQEVQCETQEEKTQIYRIVLTGGPCAGKSTAMAHISNKLMSLGFNVFVVPEAATLLITGGGLYSTNMTTEQLVRFQGSLIKVQMALEDAFVKIAKSTQKPSVIICDRGVMDGSAYIKREVFEMLLDDYGWSTVHLRDKRYDAVIHMVTAAIGAQPFYSLANNVARTETIEQAQEVDFKLINAWVGHKQLRIIDNSTDFKGKIERVTDAVCSFVGLPKARNERRKFLLMSRPDKLPENLNVEEFDSEQTYLAINDGTGSFTFVRRRGQNGNHSYTFSTKRQLKDGKFAIIERQISGSEYKTYLKLADKERQVVKKKAKCFTYHNAYFQLIEFQNPHNGLTILQTEAEPNQKVDIPDFLGSSVQEVSNDTSFQSYTIASQNHQ
jgi:predicted ATPase